MPALIEQLRARMNEEAGFTLVEMIIATGLMVVVLGGGVMVMTLGMRNEPRIAERTADIEQARVAMDRLTREIRQGSAVSSATGTSLSFITQVQSASCGGPTSPQARPCLVTYSCTQGKCTRTERNPDGSGATSPKTVASGMRAGQTVFSYTPSASAPTYVNVVLEFPSASGADSITLSDGVAMRNGSVAP